MYAEIPSKYIVKHGTGSIDAKMRVSSKNPPFLTKPCPMKSIMPKPMLTKIFFVFLNFNRNSCNCTTFASTVKGLHCHKYQKCERLKVVRTSTNLVSMPQQFALCKNAADLYESVVYTLSPNEIMRLESSTIFFDYTISKSSFSLFIQADFGSEKAVVL